MINQILQDSLIINQTKKYHLTNLSLGEIENIILNCNDFKQDEFEKLRFIIERNKTTFKITGKVYDKLIKLIRYNFVRLNWLNICRYQILSENFIREFQNEVDWGYISYNQKLSENFIREFQDRIYWSYIFQFQILSEDFIREFQNKLNRGYNWSYISSRQKLSEQFIREFQDKVDWWYIFCRQNLSKEFRKEFAHKLK